VRESQWWDKKNRGIISEGKYLAGVREWSSSSEARYAAHIAGTGFGSDASGYSASGDPPQRVNAAVPFVSNLFGGKTSDD
jgi:hypothetical protein